MKELLHTFRWQDGVDILILTIVFYQLYLWLRGKRAMRMILVILALLVFYILARWIDLPLSVWGFQNLWTVILFILVVLFQKEIREILGSVRLPRFLSGKTEDIPMKYLDKIGEAAFRMARQGIGGLIILQGMDGLEEYIHGETLLDAEINEALLVSIFNTQSPLHDGAVIIHEERIRCATALLPVSQSSSFPKDWGTRHRAGIGITEVSDAECIIISEERKEVLVASRGKVEAKRGMEELKKGLSVSPYIRQKKIRQFGWSKKLFSNLPRKILFLFLVTLLWVFVIGIRKGEIRFNIPVEYYSVPQKLEIIGDPPREINVRLKGSQRLLSSIEPERLRNRIDLSRAHAGMNEISLAGTEINVPPGVTVTNLYPRVLKVQLSVQPKSNKK